MLSVTEPFYLSGGDLPLLWALAGIFAFICTVALVYHRRSRHHQVIQEQNRKCCSCKNDICPPLSTRPVPEPVVELKSNTVVEAVLGNAPTEEQTIINNTDLVSFVEKGRIMGSNSYCSSSSTKSSSSIIGDPRYLQNRFGGGYYSMRETRIDDEPSVEDHYSTIQDVKTPIIIDFNQRMNCDDDDNNNHTDNCIVVMGTDTIIEPNLESSVQHETNENFGELEVGFLYDAPMRKMTVHVLEARHIPCNNHKKDPPNTQVRLILLPNKKQKHKTKIRPGQHAKFMESFVLHRINPEDVNSMGVRLRLYHCERMRRERLIGEAVVSFSHLNLELDNSLILQLESHADTTLIGVSTSVELASLARSDSTSGSTQSMLIQQCGNNHRQHGGVPELLLGLCYHGTTGNLTCEVVKGVHFRNLQMLHNRAPDAYVKLNLISSNGHLLAHGKTSVRRSQSNPLFKEVFVFPVALFQLADVTLMLAVYNRRRNSVGKRQKELVGWFSLGLNSTGAEELAHWMDMKEEQQQWIWRWHILVQS